MQSKAKLRRWQQRFYRQLRSGLAYSEELGIRSNRQASAQTRVAVYQSAYRTRLEESLSEDFALLLNSLGELRFQRLTKRFIEKNPSTFVDLAEYSSTFVPYLRRHRKTLNLSKAHITLAERGFNKLLVLNKNEESSFQGLLTPNSLLKKNGSVERTGSFIAWLANGDVRERRITTNEATVLEQLKSPKSVGRLAVTLKLAPEKIARALASLVRDQIVILSQRKA